MSVASNVAEIVGTKEYEVEIPLQENGIEEMLCTCPYAGKGSLQAYGRGFVFLDNCNMPIEATMRDELGDRYGIFGSCYAIWHQKKKLLSECYGIEWYTPGNGTLEFALINLQKYKYHNRRPDLFRVRSVVFLLIQ